MDDLRLLRVFREVALRGSFSAAALALDYTQPAVSQQIARLERQAGAQLLDREPSGSRLTPAGVVLLGHTERILAQLAEARRDLAEVSAGARGQVRLAALPTAAGTFVGPALAAFRRERPHVDLDLDIAFPEDAVAGVRAGEIEVAVSQLEGFGADPDTTGLHVEQLCDDAMYVALPLDHPLATQRTVALKDLASDPLMLLSAPGASPDDNLIVLAFRAAGVEPTIAHLYDDHFAVEGLVASGMGIALLPGLALASTRTDIAVRPVRGTPPRRRVVAITVDPPPPATQAMLDALRTAASTQPSPAG